MRVGCEFGAKRSKKTAENLCGSPRLFLLHQQCNIFLVASFLFPWFNRYSVLARYSAVSFWALFGRSLWQSGWTPRGGSGSIFQFPLTPRTRQAKSAPEVCSAFLSFFVSSLRSGTKFCFPTCCYKIPSTCPNKRKNDKLTWIRDSARRKYWGLVFLCSSERNCVAILRLEQTVAQVICSYVLWISISPNAAQFAPVPNWNEIDKDLALTRFQLQV